ncbi:MAG: hypothetical protein Crog4KO_22590 [Crocinitomicaceae bacterium]
MTLTENKKGKDERPSLSIPKLLLLMKTNFYLVVLGISKVVPKNYACMAKMFFISI